MHFAPIHFASLLALVVTAAGCKDEPRPPAPAGAVATTQSAAVTRKFLTAADCQKPELKTDERCDWYFDPMREAQPGDDTAKADKK